MSSVAWRFALPFPTLALSPRICVVHHLHRFAPLTRQAKQAERAEIPDVSPAIEGKKLVKQVRPFPICL